MLKLSCILFTFQRDNICSILIAEFPYWQIVVKIQYMLAIVLLGSGVYRILEYNIQPELLPKLNSVSHCLKANTWETNIGGKENLLSLEGQQREGNEKLMSKDHFQSARLRREVFKGEIQGRWSHITDEKGREIYDYLRGKMEHVHWADICVIYIPGSLWGET